MRRAQRAYAEVPDAVAALEREVERMDAPLQVALAGKLKAGKSTLLNALLGVELAASDHAECTRVLTWYRWAATPAVTVHPVRGEPWSSPPRRGPQGLQIDLRGRSAADVDRIEVAWPAPGLVRTTLVDTPGLDSLSRDVSERTREFLTRADAESAVDAVVYLMRHLHATDVRFLESFGAGRSGRGAAPGTVAVLSRADEVGVGRIDAMIAAGRVAERYRSDPALRPVCQTVVPVAGLLGLTGQTLREEEVADLRALAALDRSVTDGLMLSVDRFRRPSLGLPVAAPARAGLLARFGLFGVRLALTLLRNRGLPAAALAAELERRSGLTELRRVLDAQLTARRDTLRAQGALRTLTRLLAEHPVPDARALAADCERLTLAAHGARELDGLGMLRSQGLDLAPDVLVAAERLLGAQGDRPTDRLGLPPDTTPGRSRRRRGGPGTSGSTEVPTPGGPRHAAHVPAGGAHVRGAPRRGQRRTARARLSQRVAPGANIATPAASTSAACATSARRAGSAVSVRAGSATRSCTAIATTTPTAPASTRAGRAQVRPVRSTRARTTSTTATTATAPAPARNAYRALCSTTSAATDGSCSTATAARRARTPTCSCHRTTTALAAATAAASHSATDATRGAGGPPTSRAAANPCPPRSGRAGAAGRRSTRRTRGASSPRPPTSASGVMA
ncbi:dynamin family protein [Cellulomonas sp. ATA003]|uniref:dynamin family protein n=1 Tax=Cellulomonas sp. ATA003 TaxID=3073064 RepID=UPI0028738746|nr:dynamin family protein [Cellulomonas sp. ATA003]WNB86365.1 GTPase [Cellulomonas sp. ATA003]